MSNLNPAEGIYKIQSESLKFYSQQHADYSYRVVHSKGGLWFMVPMLQNGKEASSRTTARLGGWMPAKHLELVS